MSNLRALLAAVVADPSDDVARLVYADCLEEHGNAARAQFIRAQIEAERHHPHSRARAELEARARSLFDENWVEWWGGVCAAIGLPMPAPKQAGAWGRLASRVGLRHAPGTPYRAAGLSVQKLGWDDSGMGAWDVTFRRGFPDRADLWAPAVLTAWPRVSPLHSLRVESDWADGPHLSGIRQLALVGSSAADVVDLLASSHLNELEGLTLLPDHRDGSAEDAFAGVLVEALNSAKLGRLSRLVVRVQSQDMAAALARVPQLARLTSLEVVLGPAWHGRSAEGRLAALLRSPHLANLTDLALSGPLSPRAGLGATDGSNLRSLRRLAVGPAAADGCDELDAMERTLELEALLAGACSPALEELHVFGGVVCDQQMVDALIRSPLMKQLRYATLTPFGGLGEDDWPRLPQLFDLERLESFTINPFGWGRRRRVKELRRQFGDRLRLPE